MSHPPTDADAVRSLTRMLAARERAYVWQQALYPLLWIALIGSHHCLRGRPVLEDLSAVLALLLTALWAYAGIWQLGGDRRLARTVERVSDPSAVGAIVKAFQHGRTQARVAAANALIELLPGAAVVVPCPLTEMQYAVLHGVLEDKWLPEALPSRQKIALKLAIMDHVAAVHDTGARGSIDYLARFCSHQELRSAAIRCQARLREVAADAERSGSLLRPAEAPGETLLRAAEPVEEAQLLRPAEGAAE